LCNCVIINQWVYALPVLFLSSKFPFSGILKSSKHLLTQFVCVVIVLEASKIIFWTKKSVEGLFQGIFYVISHVFWPKFASTCLMCGGDFFFTMTYTQNLMKTPERQLNSSCPDAEIFFKFLFVHLWQNFKLGNCTFKKCDFRAISIFRTLSPPSYEFKWLKNLNPKWKLNVLWGSDVIKWWMQIPDALPSISCGDMNFRFFDLIVFNEFSWQPHQSKKLFDPPFL